jgi:hypothetical protein
MAESLLQLCKQSDLNLKTLNSTVGICQDRMHAFHCTRAVP